MASIKKLLISSKDRIHGTSSNFVVRVPDLIDLTGIELQSCIIPNTIYNITDENNWFNINEGGVTILITLQNGAYSIDDLLTELKLRLELMAAGTFTVTYSEVTLRITIESTIPFSIVNGDLLYTIGFEGSAGNTSHTGTYAVRLDIPKAFLIQIVEFHGNHCKTTGTTTPATFVIHSKLNSGYYNIFSKNTDYNSFQFYRSSTLNQLTIKLMDEDGRELDLNGGEWNILLGLSYCK